MTDSAEFGELVTLLSLTAPERLETLRARFPHAAVQLRPGAVLGPSSSDLGCSVAIDALTLYGDAAAKLCARLRQRLRWSWRFDLIAKFAAACGSGGTVGVLAAGASADKAVVTAVVALIGSVCALIFSYLQRDETANSLVAAYNRLIAALVLASELQRSLPRLCAAGASPALNDSLAKANDAAKTLNELILRFG